MRTIDQFSSGRMFLAKQGMELVQLLGPIAPFEKLELACFLYDRIMNKNSFQLILNLFDDVQERDNIIHRLGLHKKSVYEGNNSTRSPGSAITSNNNSSRSVSANANSVRVGGGGGAGVTLSTLDEFHDTSKE